MEASFCPTALFDGAFVVAPVPGPGAAVPGTAAAAPPSVAVLAGEASPPLSVFAREPTRGAAWGS